MSVLGVVHWSVTDYFPIEPILSTARLYAGQFSTSGRRMTRAVHACRSRGGRFIIDRRDGASRVIK